MTALCDVDHIWFVHSFILCTAPPLLCLQWRSKAFFLHRHF
jgi:hypothetical protein